ncbi:MAG: FxsA family protein [Hyphomicrobiaceae bacterium]
MRLVIFLALLAIPLVELALLIRLGQWIGFWPTIGIVVATALAGATVLHRQGVATLRRAIDMTQRGTPPLEPAIDGVFLLVAGAFLLTPGLLTDVAGLALLVPPLRRAIAHKAFAALMRRATVEVHVSRYGRSRPGDSWRPGGDPPKEGDGAIIEGEFERLDERDARPKPPPDHRKR